MKYGSVSCSPRKILITTDLCRVWRKYGVIKFLLILSVGGSVKLLLFTFLEAIKTFCIDYECWDFGFINVAQWYKDSLRKCGIFVYLFVFLVFWMFLSRYSSVVINGAKFLVAEAWIRADRTKVLTEICDRVPELEKKRGSKNKIIKICLLRLIGFALNPWKHEGE